MRQFTNHRKPSDLEDDLEAFVITSAILATVCVIAFELAKRWLW